MYGKIKEHLAKELESIEEAGLFKKERIITSPQDAVIKISTGTEFWDSAGQYYVQGSVGRARKHIVTAIC